MLDSKKIRWKGSKLRPLEKWWWFDERETWKSLAARWVRWEKKMKKGNGREDVKESEMKWKSQSRLCTWILWKDLQLSPFWTKCYLGLIWWSLKIRVKITQKTKVHEIKISTQQCKILKNIKLWKSPQNFLNISNYPYWPNELKSQRNFILTFLILNQTCLVFKRV